MEKNYQVYDNEGLTFEKVSHFFRSIFAYKVHLVLRNVSLFQDIDFDELKNKYGIEGIILDIDDCVAPHHGIILPENIDIIKGLIGKGFKLIIYSNMKKTDRYKELENFGIEILNIPYSKPSSKGFNICLDKLLLPSEKVVMIGDNYATDGGSVNLGIRFIKVNPIVEKNFMGFKRKVQVLLRSSLSMVINSRLKNIDKIR